MSLLSYLIQYNEGTLLQSAKKRFAREFRFRSKNGNCWSSFSPERPVF
jgi:hypothetical protein